MDVKITINGKKRNVRGRTTVFEACRQAGVYIPHFCYHPKLTIPANCRMCLVEINKAPKPMPSCATYVTDGMVIDTNSPKPQISQRGVMEFLLINHPLDCPICDQGGECQLQDLAVGYGASATRYTEKKRVVFEKHLGPLITTVMTRCIHCTRCVRFGQEIAGNMELGMVGRGEHSEIMPYIESTVDSELSGNMIDICPVGALNSKPYRFSARTWELKRTAGVARHDSWGSYIHIHSKDQQIKRVIPRDHEEINQCWISDRDRFAYTGVNSAARLLHPYIKKPDATKTQRVEWQAALSYAVKQLTDIINSYGADQVGVLLGPQVSCEEAMLAADLFRSINVFNIDFRLRQQDFELDGYQQGVAWLGVSIEEIYNLDGALLIGSDPANELPLLPIRLRNATQLAAKGIHAVGSLDLAGNLPIADQFIVPPSKYAYTLAALCQCMVSAGESLPTWITDFGEPSERHRQFAKQLQERKNPAIWLGAQAQNATDYALIYRLAAKLASLLEGFQGVLVDGANAIGIELAGATPHRGFMLEKLEQPGLNSRQMINQQLKAYVLIDCEPLDCADPHSAHAAFEQACVINIGSYFVGANEYADIMLPATSFGECMGTLVNLEGNAAKMEPAVLPPGEARPTWKILRVLANMMDVTGFTFEDIIQARAKLATAGDFSELLNCKLTNMPPPRSVAKEKFAVGEFERLAEVGHFAGDSVVRRAVPLQETQIAARSRMLSMHPADLAQLGISPGDQALVSLADQAASNIEVTCIVRADDSLARGCARLPWGNDHTAILGACSRIMVRQVTTEHQAVGGVG